MPTKLLLFEFFFLWNAMLWHSKSNAKIAKIQHRMQTKIFSFFLHKNCNFLWFYNLTKNVIWKWCQFHFFSKENFWESSKKFLFSRISKISEKLFPIGHLILDNCSGVFLNHCFLKKKRKFLRSSVSFEWHQNQYDLKLLKKNFYIFDSFPKIFNRPDFLSPKSEN